MPFDGRLLWYYTAATNVSRYFHVNALGSLGLATDQTGAPVEGMLYYPFGDEWQNTAGFGWDEKFARLATHDNDLGLYMTTHRLYDPGLGRWMTPDPLGGDVMNPQSFNRYAYVNNNPTTLTDPLGLQAGNPADPCSETWYAMTHAECPVWLGGFGWDIQCPDTPIMSCPGGPIGLGGSGGGATVTPPPPPIPPGQPPAAGGAGFPAGVGNAFLGFHLACSQATILKPTKVGIPAACVLYFLNLRLGSFPVLADIAASGIIVAGTITAIAPVEGIGGIGVSVPFAFSSQGWGCIGFGGAIGTVGKTFNFGPLTGGDLGNARDILSGLSVSTGWQSPVPFAGAQATENSSGLVYGPSYGTAGGSLSLTGSVCY